MMFFLTGTCLLTCCDILLYLVEQKVCLYLCPHSTILPPSLFCIKSPAPSLLCESPCHDSHCREQARVGIHTHTHAHTHIHGQHTLLLLLLPLLLLECSILLHQWPICEQKLIHGHLRKITSESPWDSRQRDYSQLSFECLFKGQTWPAVLINEWSNTATTPAGA